MHAVAYLAERTDAGGGGGVDIVAGRGVVGFGQPRVPVQVNTRKHPEGEGGIRELQAVLVTRNAFPDGIRPDLPIKRMRTPARDPQ